MAGPSDNIPFDAQAENLTPEAMALEQVIQVGVDAALLECRVAMPCLVTRKIDDQTVDVQPCFKTRFWGSASVDLPQIQMVPISMPQGADFRISYPVAEGDTGYLLVMDRRLDAWLAGTGGSADPEDTRAHDLSDAIFVPALVPQARHTTDTGTDLVLQNGSVTLRLEKAGRISVRNSNQELVDLLLQAVQAQIDTLQALVTAQSLTIGGPAPFIASTQAQLQNLAAVVSQIKTNLSTLKG